MKGARTDNSLVNKSKKGTFSRILNVDDNGSVNDDKRFKRKKTSIKNKVLYKVPSLNTDNPNDPQ